ncbi:MAG: hypothetical protein Q9196_003558, partial [Gyalolechia fulgens]
MTTATPLYPAGDRLKDKVCVVTGSSSGLGRAIALAFAAQGSRIVVCADLEPLPLSDFMAEEAGTPTDEVIRRRYGDGKAIFVRTNVTVGSEVEALVQTAVKLGKRLDVMVNNAGIGGTENHGPVHEFAEETWDQVMNINSRSVFLGCKYACAQFLRQPAHPSGHRGWIINTSSIMGLVGQAFHGAAYCASKGAVTLLTKQVALEYAKHKIHCNCVCPGPPSTREYSFELLTRVDLSFIDLRTPMTKDQFQNDTQRAAISALTPWGDEWGAAEDVAKGYVYLASDDAA